MTLKNNGDRIVDLELMKVEESKLFICLQRHVIDELQAQSVFAILAKDLVKKNAQETLSWIFFKRYSIFYQHF